MTYTRAAHSTFSTYLSGIALFHASLAQFPSGPPPKAAPAFSNHCPVILAAARGCSSIGRAPPLQGGDFRSSSLLNSTKLDKIASFRVEIRSGPLSRCSALIGSNERGSKLREEVAAQGEAISNEHWNVSHREEIIGNPPPALGLAKVAPLVQRQGIAIASV